MKKYIPEIATVVIILITILTSFVGFEKKGPGPKKVECGLCQEKKICMKYEVTHESQNATNWLCEDCAKLVESIVVENDGKMELTK